MEGQAQKKKSFRKQMYRGIELHDLLDLKINKVQELFCSRQKRRLARQGIKKQYERFLKKLRKAKKECPQGEKPKAVRTHLRNCIVIPEMVGSVIECYGGKVWNQFDVKAEMIGHYLGEFSLTYKLVRHGKAGVGATHSSKFTSLK